MNQKKLTEEGAYSAATWALIHAAWVCDDSDLPVRARECRQQAAEMLVRAEAYGQLVIDEPGANAAVLVDLLRRSGQLSEARNVIAERREGISEDTFSRILDFQAALVDEGDMSRHTCAEAMRYE